MKIETTQFENIRHWFGNKNQFGGAQHLIANGGKSKGTSLIRVRNGIGLDFTIVPDRGMDIYDIHFDGQQLAWLSRNGLVPSSFFSGSGMNWLKSFGGGMLTTCGLRNVGPPVTDDGEEFGLHGSISGVPAEKVNINEIFKDNVLFIEVSGEMTEANIFGENLILKRCFTISSESNTITLTDHIMNAGENPEQLMLLYHMNWGYPLLSEKTVLRLDANTIKIRGEDQSELNEWNRFLPPSPSYTERVYFFDLVSDDHQRTGYQLENPEIGKAVKVTWNKSQLPWLTEWKMMGKGDYVLGLEPCNTLPLGRIQARKEGSVEMLESNQTKVVSIEIEFLNL